MYVIQLHALLCHYNLKLFNAGLGCGEGRRVANDDFNEALNLMLSDSLRQDLRVQNMKKKSECLAQLQMNKRQFEDNAKGYFQ